jgi:hypothetical protein
MSESSGLRFNDDVKPATPVYVNDLLNGEYTLTTYSALSAFAVTLPAYGSRVYMVSLTNDSLKIANPILGVRQSESVPDQFTVHPNYPNPFNPSTVISFDLPERSRVSVVVHDLLGREVARLLDAERDAGVHEVVWDAHAAGRGVAASGMYIVRADAERDRERILERQ